MEATAQFYQTLSGMSFTLLGVWFAVLQFSHGRWLGDPQRHRANLHIALHFFLPGFLSLGALLGAADVGLIWRLAFVIGGLVGLVESLSFLLQPGPGFGSAGAGAAGHFLKVTDPALYTALILAALIPVGLFIVSPLHIAGIVVSLLFMSGLCYVWLAFAEPAAVHRPPQHGRGSDED